MSPSVPLLSIVVLTPSRVIVVVAEELVSVRVNTGVPALIFTAGAVAVPVNVGFANGAFNAIALLTVVVNVGSSPKAAAISFRVFIVPGAESIRLLTADSTNAVVAILVVLLPAD